MPTHIPFPLFRLLPALLGAVIFNGKFYSTAKASTATYDAPVATFSVYGTFSLPNHRQCVVGAVSQEGMSQRATVLIKDSISQRTLTRIQLPLPDSDFYQSRATHCTQKAGSIYLLEQVDTQSFQTLNQTLLYVSRFTHNKLRKRVLIKLSPDGQRLGSAQIAPGQQNFSFNTEGQLVLNGKVRDFTKPESEYLDFIVKLSPQLAIKHLYITH